MEQRELAELLGITATQVGHIEAGRRALPANVLLRLNPLAAQVPATPLPPLPADELTVPGGLPDPAPLEARRDYCLWKAAKLRRELRVLTARATYARRWRRALPTLLAEGASIDDAATWARTQHWLRGRVTELSAADAADWHLLRLRAEALETEAAALAELLALGSKVG